MICVFLEMSKTWDGEINEKVVGENKVRHNSDLDLGGSHCGFGEWLSKIFTR